MCSNFGTSSRLQASFLARSSILPRRLTPLLRAMAAHAATQAAPAKTAVEAPQAATEKHKAPKAAIEATKAPTETQAAPAKAANEAKAASSEPQKAPTEAKAAPAQTPIVAKTAPEWTCSYCASSNKIYSNMRLKK